MSRVAKLHPDVERALIREAQAGSQSAMDQLIDQYTPMLWKMARAVKSRFHDVDDLFQDAAIYFIQTIHKFDVSRHASLHTFSHIRVRHRLWQKCQEGGLVRTPSTVTDRCAHFAERACRPMVSIYSSRPGFRRRIADCLESPRSSEDEPNQISEKITALRDCMAALSERERYVLVERTKQKALEIIAEEFGMTREGVRKIELRSIAKIAKMLGLGSVVATIGAVQKKRRRVLNKAVRRTAAT